MQDKLVEKMMAEVMEKLKDKKGETPCAPAKRECRLTEFVGVTTHGNGIGLVIANVDPALHEAMGIDKKYRSIGILGARTGAGPFIMAADEAVKATNTEVISIELQYTARASYACNKAFGAPLGKAFGIIVGAPAAIGVVTADTALKAANVEVLAYSSPAKGTSFSNEVILAICGDSGAVRQAILAAKEVGVKLLETLGGPAPSASHPYI